MQRKWAYHVEQINMSERWSPKRQAEELKSFMARLNTIGEFGWEMVSYDAIPLTRSLSGKGYAYIAIFKQPFDGARDRDDWWWWPDAAGSEEDPTELKRSPRLDPWP